MTGPGAAGSLPQLQAAVEAAFLDQCGSSQVPLAQWECRRVSG